jgi:hypothetical protein
MRVGLTVAAVVLSFLLLQGAYKGSVDVGSSTAHTLQYLPPSKPGVTEPQIHELGDFSFKSDLSSPTQPGQCDVEEGSAGEGFFNAATWTIPSWNCLQDGSRPHFGMRRPPATSVTDASLHSCNRTGGAYQFDISASSRNVRRWLALACSGVNVRSASVGGISMLWFG